MRWHFCLFAAAMVAYPAAAKDAPMKPLAVGPDLIVEGVVEGKPARVKIMSSGPRTLFLNPALVSRIGLKAGMFGGSGRVGPVKIPISSKVITFGVGGPMAKHRVLWADRDFAPGADAGIGPGGVDNPQVRFDLRPAFPDEREVTLPLFEAEGAFGALETRIEVGGQIIGIGFDLTRDATLVTAAAAATLSQSHGARLEGAPRREMIRLDVERPVRPLMLSKPLAVGPVSLADMLARVSDYGDGTAIADADQDASEIVVTAQTGKQKPAYIIAIGRNALSTCSSLTFDKPAKLIRLRCAALPLSR